MTIGQSLSACSDMLEWEIQCPPALHNPCCGQLKIRTGHEGCSRVWAHHGRPFWPVSPEGPCYYRVGYDSVGCASTLGQYCPEPRLKVNEDACIIHEQEQAPFAVVIGLAGEFHAGQEVGPATGSGETQEDGCGVSLGSGTTHKTLLSKAAGGQCTSCAAGKRCCCGPVEAERSSRRHVWFLI